MILTIGCVLLLLGCGSNQKDRISLEQYPGSIQRQDESGEEDSEEEIPASKETGDEIYVITSVDTEKRLIGLGRTDSPRTVQYGYTDATQIFDHYGQFMSVGRLMPGRAVTIGELDSDAKLTTLQLAEDAWYQENITRFSVDTSIGMLTVGDTKYSFDRYLRVFSGDQEISVMQIREGDTISVQGLDKKILAVRVTRGHGTIALMNTQLFEGGWISLGTKIYAKITPNMTLEVPEGEYELSVANDGYGDSRQVEVVRSQVTTVDLEEYKGEGPKLCQVTFEVNVEGALLYINGEEIDYSAPVELRYGIHRLTVIADGFETWERQLVIHSEETTIQIGEPQLSGDEEEDDGKKKDGESGEKEDGEETGKKKDKSERDTSGESGSDDSESVTSEEKGTSYSDVKDSSSGDYGDYVDTIVDLIESLVGLNN